MQLQMLPSFQLNGGLFTLTRHRGLCPWTSAGGSAPDLYIGSRFRARHDWAQAPPKRNILWRFS